MIQIREQANWRDNMGWWRTLLIVLLQIYCEDDETESKDSAVLRSFYPGGRVRYRVNGEPEGWYLLVVQQPDETVPAAIARAARSRELAPDRVMAAWVLGYADGDRVRDWPHFFEWRRPGFQGAVQQLHGYRRAHLERARGYFMGPN